MTTEFKGLREAKGYLVSSSENLISTHAKASELAGQLTALINTTSDSNLYKIAKTTLDALEKLTKDLTQEKMGRIFYDYSEALKAFSQANTQHKEEYGRDITELEDAVTRLRAADLSLQKPVEPTTPGAYTAEQVNTFVALITDAVQVIAKNTAVFRDATTDVRPKIIPALGSASYALAVNVMEELSRVTQATVDQVSGLNIAAQNLAIMQDRFNAIGRSFGDSAVAEAATKAKAVAGDQRRMQI